MANSFISMLSNLFKTMLTAPASTAAAPAPGSTNSILNSFAGIEALIADVKAVFTDQSYQAKIQAGLEAALQADELVSIVYSPAIVAEVPLTLLIAALPLLFMALNLNFVQVAGTGGIAYMSPTAAKSWSGDIRHKLVYDAKRKEWKFAV